MEFKVLLVCLAFFVVTASGASVSKYGDEDRKDAVSTYTLKIDDGKKQYDETIKIDTEKKTETFHIPSTDTGPSSPGEVDVIYDFSKNLAMHRLSNQKACFLSISTENLPKPEDLAKFLEMANAQGPIQTKTSVEYIYVVVGTVDDRSILNDEMATLCAKLPIYRIKKRSLLLDEEKQNRLQRVKRRMKKCPVRYEKVTEEYDSKTGVYRKVTEIITIYVSC